jgi:transposase
MRDTDLYRQILGIEAPWVVKHVELDLEVGEVRVQLSHLNDLSLWRCPVCQGIAPLYDHRQERIWRHLDTCQYKTLLIAALPRVLCPQHGVKTVEASWSAANSHFTLLFERFAIDLLLATQVQDKAAQILRLSPGQVHDLMKRAVRRGLGGRDPQELHPQLSLDEKAVRRGHSYVTVLGDQRQGCVLDMAEGRTRQGTERLLRHTLNHKQRKSVRSVTMDMWRAFRQACHTLFPRADIVHDLFHLARHLGTAVDQTRRAECRALGKGKDNPLKGSRYYWLKREENLTPKQRHTFQALRDSDLETARVWSFKESFRHLFSCQTVEEGEAFFVSWFEEAIQTGNRFLIRVATMFRDRLSGILAYLKHRVTNAGAEGLNSRIQHLISCARGFRRFENLRIAILFFLGKLELYPQKSP